MSVLTELKIKLDSLGTLGTITIGSMPSTPDVIGTLYEYGGQATERGFNVIGIRFEKPAIQLVFRGAPNDYAGPRAKIETAWRYLAAIPPGALGAGVTTEYLMIDPQQSPFPTQPPDGNNRFYLGCNFYATKVPS